MVDVLEQEMMVNSAKKEEPDTLELTELVSPTDAIYIKGDS